MNPVRSVCPVQTHVKDVLVGHRQTAFSVRKTISRKKALVCPIANLAIIQSTAVASLVTRHAQDAQMEAHSIALNVASTICNKSLNVFLLVALPTIRSMIVLVVRAIHPAALARVLPPPIAVIVFKEWHCGMVNVSPLAQASM